MDDHQRRLLGDMRTHVALFKAGAEPVEVLAVSLRGLFDASDLKSTMLRGEFERLWGRIDAEAELRTEPWAPAEAASDHELDFLLRSLLLWIRNLLSGPSRERE